MAGDKSLSELHRLRDALRDFAAERDWEQFHAPKNLAMALAAESGELLEVFQWLNEEQSRRLSPEQRAAADQEVADVLLYLVRLCDTLDIDLFDAAWRKMAVNALRYPVDTSRGNSRKHDGR